MYCPNCGQPVLDTARFCGQCGQTINQQPNTNYNANEEQEFLDTTHRLLRWERKAWSILGKFFLIFGLIFAGIFTLVSFIAAATTDDAFFAIFMVYTIYGAMFAGIGIVNLIACNKIPQYLDNMYADFLPTRDRCGSIGMIVFTYFFNNIALVFFVINFVRMKTNKDMINRILSKQGRMLPPN